MLDTHCHIQFQAYKEDYEEIIKRCKEKDIQMNAVGTQKDTSRLAVEFAEKYDNIYATIGLHPIHVSSCEVDEEEIIFKSREEEFDPVCYGELAKSKKVIGVGECGLDLYHIPEDKRLEDILEKQKVAFIAQYHFAKERDLSLVIHVRDAHEQMIEILKSLAPKHRGVVHCYTSNWENAKKYLDLGLHLGFTGIVTFPPKKTDPKPQLELLEVIEKCPLDRMLIETDAPYLAPQAYRGQRCEPWMVEEVPKKIAEIKKIALAEVVNQVEKNSQRLFKI
ncbi:MAG TPA: TatD family hydrolase [Patescibacteria group bacterium]|nr:TatD family hydrolase [Patescibacteria group bacterium]